jgi:hypothetical protein
MPVARPQGDSVLSVDSAVNSVIFTRKYTEVTEAKTNSAETPGHEQL